MAEITYGKLNDLYGALMQLGNLNITDTSLKSSVRKNIVKLKEAKEDCDEVIKGIQRKYGKYDHKTNTYDFIGNNFDVAQKEIEEQLKKPIGEEMFLLDSAVLDKMTDLKASVYAFLSPIVNEATPPK